MEHGTEWNKQGGNSLLPARVIKEYKKSRKYVFTVNNWNEEQLKLIKGEFDVRGARYIIGKEVGKSGTPHLQGYVEFKNPIGFNTVQKIINKGHIETAKGTAEENLLYCSKDGEYETNFDKIPEKVKTREDIILEEEYSDVVWKDWQKEIIDLMETKADRRTIHWYWDKTGNVGKSFISDYLALKYNAIIADGKKDDILQQVKVWLEGKDVTEFPTVAVMDIPRCNEGFVSYGTIEKLKGRVIYSGKYEGGRCVLRPMHIIVFANFEPDYSKLSRDRWNVISLNYNDEDKDSIMKLLCE